MDFSAFDTKKIDEYARQAKESYGTTPAYKEYEEKAKNRTKEEEQSISIAFMNLFTEFGELLSHDVTEDVVQAQVEKLRRFITEHFYTCTPEILASLADMYGG